MPRPIWSGSISFGLVSIPVQLMSSKEDRKISFHMLDEKDHAPIGYKTINKRTGREVPRDRIVKGFEYASGKYVVMTDEDFERANPKKTKTVDIEEFVDLGEIDPVLYEQPYYVVPAKGGEKGYLLLKKVMDETGKVAIGTFVLRDKQKLVALLPRGDYLVLETLRYAHEVLTADEVSVVHDKIEGTRISPKELHMAESLVKGMSSARFNPEKYRDTYYNDVMRLIRAKVKGGKSVESLPVEEAPEPAAGGKVLDLMPLLKQSLESNGGSRARGTGHSHPHAHARRTKKGKGHGGSAHVH